MTDLLACALDDMADVATEIRADSEATTLLAYAGAIVAAIYFDRDRRPFLEPALAHDRAAWASRQETLI